MKSKNLSRLTFWSFVWFAILVVLTLLPEDFHILREIIFSLWFPVIFGISFFLLAYVIASQVMSNLALSAFKGRSIDFLESMYRWYWILLTDEARQEWQKFISMKKLSKFGKIQKEES